MTDDRKREKVKRVLKEAGTSAKRRLSKEILILFLLSLAAAASSYFFFRSTAGTVIWTYCNEKGIILTQMQQMDTDFLVETGSLTGAALVFILSFFLLFGRKLAYLQQILDGVEALRIHRMDYVIPVKGKNEFTDLARSINYLSDTERLLKEKEQELKKERELLIRALSHDIRTPLTSILAYTELMEEKIETGNIGEKEIKDYIALIGRKAEQMKELTDQLLENSRQRTERIDNGKLLMEQLVFEWEEMLEDRFRLEVDIEECPAFSGEIDVGQFRRIFDNLYSNIEKYADTEALVFLKIHVRDGRLAIVQKNKKKKDISSAQGHQIGLLSIKAIAGYYDGSVEVKNGEEDFEILIRLLEIAKQ